MHNWYNLNLILILHIKIYNIKNNYFWLKTYAHFFKYYLSNKEYFYQILFNNIWRILGIKGRMKNIITIKIKQMNVFNNLNKLLKFINLFWLNYISIEITFNLICVTIYCTYLSILIKYIYLYIYKFIVPK